MHRRRTRTWLGSLACANLALLVGCQPAPHALRLRYSDRPETARYAAYLEPRLRPIGEFAPREEWWGFAGHDVHIDRMVPPAWVERRHVKIVLLHGGGGNGRLLAPFAVMLARHGYESVAPDLPPYGLTRRGPGTPLTWEAWVELASALSVHESDGGKHPIVVFGASLGGMTAVQAAERTPSIVATIATTLLDMRDPDLLGLVAGETVLARAGVFFTRHAPWLSAGLWLPAREVAPIDKLANDTGLAALAEDDALIGGAQAPGSFWRSLHRPTCFVEPELVQKPVLLVHPGEDRWTPPEASLAFFARIGGEKRAVILTGGGHFPIEPEAMAHLEHEVISFLDAAGARQEARADGAMVCGTPRGPSPHHR
jgi:pimeloyl-ACP methyl ester carboxylesterase